MKIVIRRRFHFQMVLLYSALILSSCTINGSFQGLRSYYPDSVEAKPNLFVHLQEGQSICNNSEEHNNKVIVITAAQLKECLLDKRSIVYVWGPKCHSTVCKGLNESQHLSDSADVNLFVVDEYYDAELMDLNYRIDHPIIGINTEHYNSEWTKTYLSRFLTELADKKMKHTGGRFIVFNDGNMKGRYRTIEDAISSVEIASPRP
jgi:hypothetical protein